MKSQRKIILIYGGQSTEHEVSRKSAAFVYRNFDRSTFSIHPVGIDKNGVWHPQDIDHWPDDLQSLPLETKTKSKSTEPIDSCSSAMAHLCGLSIEELSQSVIFPMIHGATGEDGTLQGFIELAGVPFVGADTLGSAVGMDKVVTKRMAASAGIPVVPFVEIEKSGWDEKKEQLSARVVDVLGLPVFIKPARLGSSVGISKAKTEGDVISAIESAFLFDDKILVESALDVREVECAMLGGYRPAASVIGEVVLQSDFYSYEEKYSAQTKATTAVPADIPEALSSELQRLSKRVFEVLCLHGMARIDWFLEKGTGQIYLNEVNTIPGFTDLSHYPLFWNKSGKNAKELIDSLIDCADARAKVKAALIRTR